MIGKLLFKGMMAGVLAGMVAVAFAHHFGEPQVDRAIGLEKSMSAHAHHHGASADGEEEEVFSRPTQSGIGLMTGMSYEGVAAGEIPQIIKDRLHALVNAVDVPTLAEGGINVHNAQAFRDTGVDILVVGTAIDNMVQAAAKEAVLPLQNNTQWMQDLADFINSQRDDDGEKEINLYIDGERFFRWFIKKYKQWQLQTNG